ATRWLDRDDADAGLARFQHLADASYGATSADTGDERIDRALGVVPNLFGSGAAVDGGVGGVGELLRDHRVLDLRGELFRPLDCPAHAGLALGQHQLGSE